MKKFSLTIFAIILTAAITVSGLVISAKVSRAEEQARITTENIQKASLKIASRGNVEREIDVFDLDLREPSRLSAKDYDTYFAGYPLEGLGDLFESAEKLFHINGALIAAMAAHESGRGTSRLAITKNNLFGFTAYTNSAYRSATHFKTVADGVIAVSQLISKEYLDTEGKYFRGIALQAININYAQDATWYKQVGQIMKEILSSSRK